MTPPSAVGLPPFFTLRAQPRTSAHTYPVTVVGTSSHRPPRTRRPRSRPPALRSSPAGNAVESNLSQGGMKHADLSGCERELVEAVRDEVREDLRALGAHVSLELEDRFALLEARLDRLEQLVRERRTVIVRRPKKEKAK